MAVDIARQGLGSPQGQRDGWVDLPEKEVGGITGADTRAQRDLGVGLDWKAAGTQHEAGRGYGCWAGQAPLRVRVQGMEVGGRDRDLCEDGMGEG